MSKNQSKIIDFSWLNPYLAIHFDNYLGAWLGLDGSCCYLVYRMFVFTWKLSMFKILFVLRVNVLKCKTFVSSTILKARRFDNVLFNHFNINQDKNICTCNTFWTSKSYFPFISFVNTRDHFLKKIFIYMFR